MDCRKVLAHIVSLCDLNQSDILIKGNNLYNMIERLDLIDLPILVGFDINGPLVSTKDATMTPFAGAPEAIRFLSLFPKTKLCLVTGWDYSTAFSFASMSLGMPDMAIISEKGMVYSTGKEIIHLYPNSDKEISKLASSVLGVAQRHGLQVAVQGNVSSGCQCVYIEGFNRAKLSQHPLLRNVTVDSISLKNALNRRRIEFSNNGDIFQIQASAKELYNMLRFELPLFPIRFIKNSSLTKWNYSIKADSQDIAEFSWQDFKSTINEICINSDRNQDLNKDYSADMSTKLAVSGGFSKDMAIKELGKIFFGNNCLITNVGDKVDDKIGGENTLFFPQLNTDAVRNGNKDVFPVINGMEYALLISCFTSKC